MVVVVLLLLLLLLFPQLAFQLDAAEQELLKKVKAVNDAVENQINEHQILLEKAFLHNVQAKEMEQKIADPATLNPLPPPLNVQEQRKLLQAIEKSIDGLVDLDPRHVHKHNLVGPATTEPTLSVEERTELEESVMALKERVRKLVRNQGKELKVQKTRSYRGKVSKRSEEAERKRLAQKMSDAQVMQFFETCNKNKQLIHDLFTQHSLLLGLLIVQFDPLVEKDLHHEMVVRKIHQGPVTLHKTQISGISVSIIDTIEILRDQNALLIKTLQEEEA